jgi:transposase-like protein
MLAKSEVDQLLQTGLADFSLRELLGLLMSTAGTAERSVYLEKEPTDKPNGFYDRSLQLGTLPVDVRVPRTRTGEFRPATLPSRYRRGYSE